MFRLPMAGSPICRYLWDRCFAQVLRNSTAQVGVFLCSNIQGMVEVEALGIRFLPRATCSGVTRPLHSTFPATCAKGAPLCK